MYENKQASTRWNKKNDQSNLICRSLSSAFSAPNDHGGYLKRVSENIEFRVWKLSAILALYIKTF